VITPYLNRITTAVPAHNVHDDLTEQMLANMFAGHRRCAISFGPGLRFHGV
jgi:hypothetical protein